MQEIEKDRKSAERWVGMVNFRLFLHIFAVKKAYRNHIGRQLSTIYAKNKKKFSHSAGIGVVRVLPVKSR